MTYTMIFFIKNNIAWKKGFNNVNISNGLFFLKDVISTHTTRYSNGMHTPFQFSKKNNSFLEYILVYCGY